MPDRIFWAIGIIIVAIVVMFVVKGCENSEVRQYFSNKGYTVVSVDETFVDLGPFWVKSDGQSIYKVVVTDQQEQRRVFYYRTGLFGPDVEEYHD